MADVAKSGPLHLIQTELTTIMTFLTAMDGVDALKRNSLVRKYRAKILSRLALRLLPHQPSVGRHRKGTTESLLLLGVSDLKFQEELWKVKPLTLGNLDCKKWTFPRKWNKY